MESRLNIDTSRLINTFELNNAELISALIGLIKAEGDVQNRKTNVKASMSSWKLPIDHTQHPFNIFFDFFNQCFLTSTLKLIHPSHKLNDRRYYFSDLWGVVYQKDDHTYPHNHFPSYFSFCYYLKTTENSSPLVFDDTNVKIKPTTGMLVLFPGWMIHSVPPQLVNEERILLSGNITVS